MILPIQYRSALSSDLPLLAVLNHQLIRDEGHRNIMDVAALQERMAGWLARGEYQAILFFLDGDPAGYALFACHPHFVELRQFFIAEQFRRRGVGRAAMQWLRDHSWQGRPRVRVDVLAGNSRGQAFWRATGFADYAVTLELEMPPETTAPGTGG